MTIKEVRKDFLCMFLNEPKEIKLSELLKYDCEKCTKLYTSFKQDEISKYKLQYLSFLSALINMGDITYKQYNNEVNKYVIYVYDVLNKDGSFKEYLNEYTIKKLKKYFDNLNKYCMSDIVPHDAF